MIADNKKHQAELHQKEKGDRPLVSIGLPTYNGAKRIVATVTSIINQGYANLEIIISDNCSSDSTEKVCTELCSRHNTIRYFRQKENIGIIPNFEFVLNKATGKLFMWVADDDSLEAGILDKYVDFLIAHPDYSLVSGQIQYWTGNKAEFLEKDFSMEHNSMYARVISYYSKVKHGAIFYGLMRIEVAAQIKLQNRMGEDWHVVAKTAYLGKIKMLNCLGYHKRLNGSSKTLKLYAKIIGATRFSANFPHAQIAMDAFVEIMTSPLYSRKWLASRLGLAIGATGAILFNHYFTEFPFIIAGRFKRLLGIKKPLRSSIKNSFKGEWGILILLFSSLQN